MEAIFQRLEMHMTFICPECGEMFELQQQWRKHLNFHHDYLCKTPEDFGFVEVSERYHECGECKQLVADGKRAIALLQYHRFIHLPFKCTYRCRHCSGTFMRKRICFNHLCRTHENIIGKKLAAAALKTPMLSNRKDSRVSGALPNYNCLAKENPEFYLRFICPQCGLELDTQNEWQHHIKESHRNTLVTNNAMQRIVDTNIDSPAAAGSTSSSSPGRETYMCKICDKILNTNDVEKHQRHYFMHLPHKLWFRCTYCRVRRPYKTEVLHHFMITHLIAFEKQRVHMKKPKEFGNDINQKLDRELDLLLKYGNNIGGTKSSHSIGSNSISTWPKHYNGSIVMTPGGNVKKSFVKSQLTPPMANKNLNTKITSDTRQPARFTHTNDLNIASNGDHTNARKGRSPSSIKKELDALCAEIFKDIDNDETTGEVASASEETGVENPKLSKVPDSNGALTDFMADDCFINDNDIHSKANNNEEEIVSIEIDTLNEHELNQMNYEMVTSISNDEAAAILMSAKRRRLNDSVAQQVDTKPKILSSSAEDRKETFANLKELYNAKVVHLCPQCGISFNDQSIWRTHILKVHGDLINKLIEESFKFLSDQTANLCLICNDVLLTTSKTELQRHRFTHMPYSAYLKCTLCDIDNSDQGGCGNTFESSKPKMLEHLENNHANFLNCTPQHQQNIHHTMKAIKSENSLEDIYEKTDFKTLCLHLKNSRERLNRMAIECGIETL